MVSKRFVTYDDVNTMLAKMFRDMAIAGYKPDLVVGLVRGGMVPAIHVSHYFDVPMMAFKYSLRDHPGKDAVGKLTSELWMGRNVLIVDDICDEGHTLHDIYTEINMFDPLVAASCVKTAVLQHNLGSGLFTPDFCGEEINKVEKPEWIVYPWEY